MTETALPSEGHPLKRTASSLKLRLYVMMFLQYFVQGSYLPVISSYLQDALGFSPNQIGMFGSALAVGPILAPFVIGQIVDRHLATERVLAFCHLVGGILMLVLYFQHDYLTVIVLGMLYSTLYVPTMMLTNSLTFHHLKDRDREFPAVRLWGTVGFVVPAWLVEFWFLKGLTGEELNTTRGIILAFSGFSGLAMGVYSLFLPHTPPQRDGKAKLAPGRVLGLLQQRDFLMLVLFSLLIAVVHKFYFVWNSPYLSTILAKQEITGAWEQRISSIGQIFEVVVMAGLGLMIHKIGFKRTMTIGTLAYLIRCLIFSVSTMIESTTWFTVNAPQGPLEITDVMVLVCVGQAFHGLCFGCFLATAFMYVDRVASSDVRGSMQTFYGTFVLGLGAFLGGFISGKVGDLFTTVAGEPTIRDRFGIVTQTGVTTLAGTDATGHQTQLLRDWPGIWLSGAVLAGVAALGFGLLFPSEKPAETDAETNESPEELG